MPRCTRAPARGGRRRNVRSRNSKDKLGRALADEGAVGRRRDDIAEQRPVEGVDAGRRDTDRAEAEREDRVFRVPRIVMQGAVGRQQGQVCVSAKRTVERYERGSGIRLCGPFVLESAGTGLGVGTAVDATLGTITTAPGFVAAQIPVVAEREPTLGIDERLGIGQRERRKP